MQPVMSETAVAGTNASPELQKLLDDLQKWDEKPPAAADIDGEQGCVDPLSNGVDGVQQRPSRSLDENLQAGRFRRRKNQLD